MRVFVCVRVGGGGGGGKEGACVQKNKRASKTCKIIHPKANNILHIKLSK